MQGTLCYAGGPRPIGRRPREESLKLPEEAGTLSPDGPRAQHQLLLGLQPPARPESSGLASSTLVGTSP